MRVLKPRGMDIEEFKTFKQLKNAVSNCHTDEQREIAQQKVSDFLRKFKNK